MLPNRELDWFISEHVMELTHASKSWVKPYSTDVKEAWEVLEKLKEFNPELGWDNEKGVWSVRCAKGNVIPATDVVIATAICLLAYEYYKK